MPTRFAWAIIAASACRFEAPPETPREPITDIDSGRHVPPAGGRAFALMVLSSTTAGGGLDLGGFEDFIRSNLVRAHPALLIEIAGTDASGSNDRATINFYVGSDANDTDDDNFLPLDRDSPCCEYTIDPISLAGAPPTPIWSAPAIGLGDRYASSAPGRAFIHHVGYVNFSAYWGVEFDGLGLEQARVELDIAEGGSHVTGRLTGALPIAALHRAPTSDFTRPDITALELVLEQHPPNVDLDGDGLETFTLGPDGNVTECRDGDGSLVPSWQPMQPDLCPERSEMADGYFVAHRFAGVPAHLTIADD